MKKIFTVVAAVLMAATLGAGCSSATADKSASSSAPASATAAGEKKVIKFAVQADSTKALDTLVQKFNESNKQFKAEPVVMTNDSGNMHDQLLNSLSSKSGEYDVISMDVVWAGEFAAAGYLQPLDEVIKSNNWKVGDFNKGSMDSGKYKGMYYALPYFSDLGFLYIRQDIVSPEDIAKLQSGQYSWQELLEMAEKYNGQNDTKYGFVYQSKQYEGLTCNLNEFSNNWQDVKGGLSTMKAFMDAKVVPEDILNYTEGESQKAFTNGEAVFLRNWPYVNGMIMEDKEVVKSNQVTFAPLPNGGTIGGWILGINANSKNKEGAEAFISFMAGPEGQKINATVGSYMPGYNKLLEDADVLKANILLNNDGFKNALKTTIARPVVPNYAQVSDNIQIKAHEFLSGNGTLEEAAKGIEDAMK